MAQKKKSRKWLILGLLLLIGILGVAAYFKAKSKPKGTEVTVEEVEKRSILETVSASGRVFPEKEIKISSDVSGEIVELYVEEGDSVVMGQVLAKIDPETYVSAVERGEAAVNNSKSQQAMSRAQIETSRAQKEQIIAQLENAKAVHKRNEQLLSDGVISQADFDQSLSNLKSLEANLRSSEASMKSAEESVKAAQFSVKSAEATLKELRTSLNRTTIKAPASGVVSSLSVEQGERVVGTIQMAGTEMMRIANLNAMEVQVDVSENDILRVELSDKVKIEVDAYLDRKFDGVVTEIANSASNITGAAGAISLNTDQVTNFVVKIRLDSDSYQDLISTNNPYPFRPGMSATVDVETENMEDVISVPIQAVTTREREDEDSKKKSSDEDFDEVVFVQSADTVKMIIVKTGIQDDDYIQVKSGLEGGETIVTGPYSAISKKLKSGEIIRVKEEGKDEEEE